MNDRLLALKTDPRTRKSPIFARVMHTRPTPHGPTPTSRAIRWPGLGLLLGVFVLLAAPQGQSQIINTEIQRLRDRPDGWAGNAQSTASWTRNVADILQLRATLRVQHRRGPTKWLLLAEEQLLNADGDDAVNRGYVHLRLTQQLTRRWAWEAFGQLQNDLLQRLDLRGAVGSGPRWRIYRDDSARTFVYAGLLYVYMYEAIRPEGTEIPWDYRREHRKSSYLSLSWRSRTGLHLTHTSYWQPRWDDWADWRLSTELALAFPLTAKFSFSAGFEYLHDNRPPRGLSIDFFVLRQGIEWRF